MTVTQLIWELKQFRRENGDALVVVGCIDTFEEVIKLTTIDECDPEGVPYGVTCVLFTENPVTPHVDTAPGPKGVQ